MAIPRSCFADLMEAILMLGAKHAVKYVSTRETAKATYRGRRDRRGRSHTILVTVGAPNYEEREFIKKLKKAGEPFPVKKIQMKFTKAK